MISAPIFKRSLVELLWRNVDANLALYESGDLKPLLSKPDLSDYQREVSGVRVDVDALGGLKTEAIGATDAFNANILFDSLPGMTPYLAADERIWVALTHLITPEFSYKRYLKDSNASVEEKIRIVRAHFFAHRGVRDLHRNNALSCLWWYAHVCKRNTDHDTPEVLKAVLTLTDFRNSLLERPTSARVEEVFNAITNIVIDEYGKSGSPDIMKRRNYRLWLRKINLHGGRKLYATMDSGDLEHLFRGLMP